MLGKALIELNDEERMEFDISIGNVLCRKVKHFVQAI